MVSLSVDLMEDAELFAVSSRLVTASRVLKKLVVGESLDGCEEKSASYVANMISAIDRGSTVYNAQNFPCVLATRVRPDYFGARIDALVFGVPTQDQGFLDRICQTLSSAGREVYLDEEELRQASVFLDRFSDRFMARLTRYSDI
ncbi:hypothetical protein HYV88_04400 [Candidatus Woesearchaeota archaeon]|nr:hypothetical protein [Candidatus Woesearchaeota archaeon]